MCGLPKGFERFERNKSVGLGFKGRDFGLNWLKKTLIMKYVNNFRDLEVYKLSRQLSKEIFEISKTFPKEERYSLTDQIRRSSRSTGAQIAEAWAKRKYEKHFVSKLTDADGEQLETQHWIEILQDCFYLSKESADDLLGKDASVERMIKSMIDKESCFLPKS
jgi:four helix bundle protein